MPVHVTGIDGGYVADKGRINMKSDIYTAPAVWARALVNGDYSSLDVADTLACRAWQESILPAEVVGTDDEPRFTWSYRLYGGSYDGGDVLDYQTLEAP